MRISTASVVVVLLLVLTAAVPAGAEASKTVVCHQTGNGAVHAIEVSDNAVAAHQNHGDGLIGDPVPGMDGFVFGEDCIAEPVGPAPGCYENVSDSKQDLLYAGPVDTPSNIQASNTTDGNCGLASGSGLALVVADDSAAADAKCLALNGSLLLGVSLFDFGYTGFPPNAWVCGGTS